MDFIDYKLGYVCGIIGTWKGGELEMPIKYKIDILAALKEAGYSSYRIQKEQIINNVALQKLREGKLISWEQLDKICVILHCQPGDLVEHVDDLPERP